MTDLQLATQLNGGYRPMSFKRYEDGHMVIITHQGKKVTIAGEIVKKVGQSLKEKAPARSAPAHAPAQAEGPERAPATTSPAPSPRVRGDKRGGKSGSAKGK